MRQRLPAGQHGDGVATEQVRGGGAEVLGLPVGGGDGEHGATAVGEARRPGTAAAPRGPRRPAPGHRRRAGRGLRRRGRRVRGRRWGADRRAWPRFPLQQARRTDPCPGRRGRAHVRARVPTRTVPRAGSRHARDARSVTGRKHAERAAATPASFTVRDSRTGEARLGFRSPGSDHGRPGPRDADGRSARPSHGGTKARETAGGAGCSPPAPDVRSAVALPPPQARRHTRRRLPSFPRCTRTTAPRPRSPCAPRPGCRPRSGRRRSPAGWSLPGADSIVDRRIPTFSRGELPHFAGINTFLKAPYVEDVRRCGEYDVAVLGAPFDGGTTYRSGTRFGPQGIRKISALYGPYSFELGVDLRETHHHRRPRRHLHDPRQHREDVRPDQQGRLARLRQRRVPRRARRRPLDRLPDHPRRRAAPERRQPRDHPLRPPRRHPGDRPRRADAHHAVVPRHGHPERPGQEPRADRHRRLAGAAARA